MLPSAYVTMALPSANSSRLAFFTCVRRVFNRMLEPSSLHCLPLHGPPANLPFAQHWPTMPKPMTPEEKAREKIDAMLAASGWTVQTKDKINLSADRGVALCELSFKTGEPDYTLFVDSKSIGTIEAKPEGDTLTGVEEQSTKYVSGIPFGLPAWKSPLPFCYESTGTETFFTNRLDPDPRSRRVFSFHRPETLVAWVQLEKQLAQRLCEFSPLAAGSLWPAQIQTIAKLEQSFAA